MKKLSFLFSFICVFALVGCSHTQTRSLQGSSRLPAAEGKVKVSQGSNDNSKLDIHVKHMAEPGKAFPGSNSYVVWVQPTAGDARPYNLGGLKVNDNKEGKLETVVPYKTFNIFVTAEPSSMVTSPSGETLLWTQVGQLAE